MHLEVLVESHESSHGAEAVDVEEGLVEGVAEW